MTIDGRTARPARRPIQACAITVAAMLATTGAHAAGTAAGSTISNQANASFTDPGGTTVKVPSNRVDLRVDELLDVTVVSADPGDVTVQPGGTNRVLSFTVTNTGNGDEAYKLSFANAIAGDDFDPTTTSLVIDSNNNGVYDASVDVVYNPGVNDPVFTPDQSIRVFVLSTIPGTATDAQRGFARLVATAVTGTGTPGTVFAGKGTGGSDAIVGNTTANANAQDAYRISAATVALVKSATVLDPFGGSKSVPGSIVTYALVATTTGSGTIKALGIDDAVPVGTTYVPGSITLGGTALTDAADADAGSFAAQAIAVRLGDVPGGQTRTVTFKTKIN